MASELKPCPFCGLPPMRNELFAWCSGPSDKQHNLIQQTHECWNTRPAPAATDTGLETLAHMAKSRMGWVPAPHWSGEAVCLRSQAEELLAAERAEKEKAQASRLYWKGKHQKLEADNAALTARVKELEDRLEFDPGGGDRIDALESALEFSRHGRECLEAKLAAAEKALEHLTLHANSLALADIDRTHGRTGFWKALKEARAVLGGKTS